MTFSNDELIRYSRHFTLPDFGVEGQERLRAGSVLLVGAGGLGSPAAMYLAAAGVGRLGIVDFDSVDLSNLQRQILHDSAAVGQSKADSATRRLGALNPHVTVEPIRERLTSANALEILARYDVIVDGSDNFPTRYLVNDAAVLLGRPYVYGAILRFEGQVSVFDARRGPCYRCLFREPPPPELVPSCAEAGVLGVLPGIIGSMQALEAIKLLAGIGEPLVGRLLIFDALKVAFREIALRRDPACPLCGAEPTITSLIDYDAFCGVAPAGSAGEVTATELARLRRDPAVLVLDVREPWEWGLCRIEGSLHIPLGELPARLSELDAGRDIIAVCRSGARSRQAVEFLRAAGFPRVRNAAGGLVAWRARVDPAFPAC